MNKRFKAVYAIVILLALYQLAISAFASADARTVSERHLLLLGDLLLLLPLLLVPLGSRLFVWRPPPPSPEASQGTLRSSSSRSGSDTGIRAWGFSQAKVAAGAVLLGPAFQASSTGQSFVLHTVQCTGGGAARGDTEDESPRSAVAVSMERYSRPTTTSRAVPTTFSNTHTNAEARAERQSSAPVGSQPACTHEPGKRSQPIPIRSKVRSPAFDETLEPSEPQVGQSAGWRPQHSSGAHAAHAADLDAAPHLAGALASLLKLKPEPLPQSTRSLSENTASGGPAGGAAPSAAHSAEGRAAEPNLSPLQCTESLDFWLLFTVFGVNAGCGLLLNNNIGAHMFRTPALHTHCCALRFYLN